MSKIVIISREAKLDILDIWIYLYEHEGMAEADKLIKKLESVIYSLCDNPERGHIPPELETVNEFNYREIHSLPYRVIYKILSGEIIIYCVLDGRRDMQSLLYQRLIRV